MFRSADPNNEFYLFTVTNNGLYGLSVIFNQESSRILLYGRSSAFNIGQGRSNLLGVMASNNTISLFVNDQFVKSVSDDTLITGTFGLLAEDFHHVNADVAISNAQIWETP